MIAQGGEGRKGPYFRKLSHRACIGKVTDLPLDPTLPTLCKAQG